MFPFPYISPPLYFALRGLLLPQILHAPENDQGLLAHIPPGRGPPTVFNNEHSKIGFKFSVLAVITLEPAGVTSRNFST